jgi:two-component system phosphate regulon response regulator PhoB
MAAKQVFIVEDEADILELMTFNLERDGFRVAAAADGEIALKAIRRSKPDLVLLDLMLPGLGGLDVCRLLKGDPATAPIPVVMVTAKGEEADIVTGLELGAADYVTKPFSMKILVARVRAALRRGGRPAPEASAVVRVHDITIDPARHEVLCGRSPVDLTASEFGVLHFLASSPGRVFTREQIMDGVKGADYAVTDRAVDVQMVSLRRKLGRRGEAIETVRGVGYRFKE